LVEVSLILPLLQTEAFEIEEIELFHDGGSSVIVVSEGSLKLAFKFLM
jgi:predicted naringenin-chalcone synthase